MTRLKGIRLSDADLSRAELGNCKMIECILNKTRFTAANLSGATIAVSVFHQANFQKAKLSQLTIRDSMFDAADFSGAVAPGLKISKSVAVAVKFCGADLTGACLEDSSLSLGDFRKANLSRAVLRLCQFHEANFSSCDLSGADLTKTELYGADFSTAVIRAAIAGFADSDFFQNFPEPIPIVAAQVPLGPPPQADQAFDRLVRMAAAALRECLEDSKVDPHQTAVLLTWREPFREDRDLDGKDDALLAAIEERLGLKFHAASRVIPEGKAGAFRGIQESRILLTAGVVSACLTGGIDSYVNADDMIRFESVYRIKREGVARGFIPGEGAAFIALAAPGKDWTPFAKARGEILGVGLATEDPSVTLLSDGHPTGRGLQRALQATIQDAFVAESWIAFRVSDQNGESYHSLESTFALSRFYMTHREEFPLWLSAASVGEIGAAVGPLLVMMASIAMEKNYAPGALAMCEASSDGGLRAGCLVGPTAPPSGSFAGA